MEGDSSQETKLDFKGIDIKADHFIHSIMILEITTATTYFVQHNI